MNPDDARFCAECGNPFAASSGPGPKAQALPPGSRLWAGRCRIITKLGQGGFGITYKAQDEKLGREVAIKEYFPARDAERDPNSTNIRPRSGDENQVFEQGKIWLLKEAVKLAKIRHPNIVTVFDYFEENNSVYLVMEYLEGPDLFRYRGKLGSRAGDDDELEKLLGGVLDALEIIHRHGIVHRDISPDNLICVTGEDGRDRAVLIDFGASARISRETAPARRGSSFVPAVKDGYSPIENYHSQDTQPCSDVYSLAATWYFMVTGMDPPVATLRSVRDSLESPAEHGYRGRFLAGIMAGLAFHPDSRPQSIPEWRTILFGTQGGGSPRPTPKPQPRPEPPPRPEPKPEPGPGIALKAPAGGKRRGAVAYFILLVLLLTGAGMGAWLFMVKKESPAAPGKGGARIRISTLPLPEQPSTSAPSSAPMSEAKFTNSLGMAFVYCPPGTFMMGSPKSEPERNLDETQHQVTLTKGFYIGTTEVTQGQWKAVMGNNPSAFSSCGDDCPVEQVSWDDCQEFLRKLNDGDPGKGYRLPTEAEWEYACRAGSQTAYCFGNSGKSPDAYGWFSKNSRRRTHPAANMQPNAWGLYDMHGNVWEWCADIYDTDYYIKGQHIDPEGNAFGSVRVTRGGSWHDGAWRGRSACRAGNPPSEGLMDLGFRVACSPTGKKVSASLPVKEAERPVPGKLLAGGRLPEPADTSSYSFNPAGKVDPFNAPARKKAPKVARAGKGNAVEGPPPLPPGTPPSILPNYDWRQLKLVAVIVSRAGAYMAMVSDPSTKKGYAITKGVRIGRTNALVTEITMDHVTVEEMVKDYVTGEWQSRPQRIPVTKTAGQ